MSHEHNEETNGQSKAAESSIASRKKMLVIAALLLVAAAAGLGYWFIGSANRSSVADRPVPTPDFDVIPSSPGAATSGEAPRPGDLLITIQPEKLANAHFKYEAAVAQTAAVAPGDDVRTTGTVEANAYKVVLVLPVAGGIVRQVNFELGDKVQRGAHLATIFSTELADAQTAYLSMLAEIERHHQRYKRAQALVEIGATSREEFEEVKAEYKIEQAKLTAAQQRLALYGMSKKQTDELRDNSQMSALLPVEAPASGTLLSRTVNAGEVVATGKELFRIADLSTVWVIGQIYEKDFATVRAGTAAVITAPAYPGKTFTGRISYIDPRVEAQMRTAQVRVEVRNPGEMLRLGMFVDVIFGGAMRPAASEPVVNVPRSAVQTIGAKQVVYVVTNQAGTFAQREVSAGAEADGLVPIYAGLNADERVVTEGSFLLRAESLKLNPAQLTAAATPPTAQKSAGEQAQVKPAPSAQQKREDVQAVTVTLTEKGYQPESFKLKQGVPARVTFVRKVEATCGSEIVLADYNIKRELPFNQPVTVEFTPSKSGAFKFACGMDMLRGKIIVQ
jgi:membrane fusion protein, heavy metal efflux system